MALCILELYTWSCIGGCLIDIVKLETYIFIVEGCLTNISYP